MVRLTRGPAPSKLTANAAKWTKRWQEIHSGARSGDWATRTAKRLLSGELRKLTFGKCAYCESLLDVTSYLEVEHYWPKTLRSELAFDWPNLLPACGICNNAKRDKDHSGLLIKPDEEDPETLLWLNPDSGKLERRAGLDASAVQRVERTIELCALQRGPLCVKRIATMESAIHWLERMRKADELSQPLQREWRRLKDPGTEFKFVIRHVFETRNEPRLAAHDRLRFDR